jgi:hypothetical protein
MFCPIKPKALSSGAPTIGIVGYGYGPASPRSCGSTIPTSFGPCWAHAPLLWVKIQAAPAPEIGQVAGAAVTVWFSFGRPFEFRSGPSQTAVQVQALAVISLLPCHHGPPSLSSRRAAQRPSG